jgi:cell division protein FtsN
VLRRAGRNALRDRQGGFVRSGVNALVGAAGAVVVVGAVFLAFNPTSSTNLAPARQSSAYFKSSAPAPVAQDPAAVRPHASAEPRAVPAAAITDPKQIASEHAVVVAPMGRADASGPIAGVAPEEARSPATTTSSKPPTVTGSAPAEKSAGNRRNRSQTQKLAQKHKQSPRRHETVAPGYAFAPYGAPRGGYGYWSAPWGFR